MNLTPKEIVAELSRYIIGQDNAKKAVAIALRNRYRRAQLSGNDREEITPKNIIMKGPTGVGKTEIARRLAKIVQAPFVKVEATKFTEVGYVGRDVESMIRDLAEVAVRIVREERMAEVEATARNSAEKKMLKVLYALKKDKYGDMSEAQVKAHIIQELRAGIFDREEIEIALPEIKKPIEIMPGSGMEVSLGNIFDSVMPKKEKVRRVSVKEAMVVLMETEASKLIDEDSINDEAMRRAENDGIIFIDEIDKVASRGGGSGPDVSREGVQRDILPIVEGSTVKTKYGAIRTDFILFIASGAFHMSSFKDLIPELQGRFPIVVELESLSEDDFVKILTTPDNAILKQYAMLLGVDKLNLEFTEDAIREIAKIAADENAGAENIGARRLHTVMENLLDELSFEADGAEVKTAKIDGGYVKKHFENVTKTMNLRKYIL